MTGQYHSTYRFQHRFQSDSFSNRKAELYHAHKSFDVLFSQDLCEVVCTTCLLNYAHEILLCCAKILRAGDNKDLVEVTRSLRYVLSCAKNIDSSHFKSCVFFFNHTNFFLVMLLLQLHKV